MITSLRGGVGAATVGGPVRGFMVVKGGGGAGVRFGILDWGGGGGGGGGGEGRGGECGLGGCGDGGWEMGDGNGMVAWRE